MRTVVNEKKIRRNRKIAQYAFFITLGILIVGLFVTNAAPSNPLLLFAPLIVLPVALGATLYSVRMANLWLREPRPESVLKDGLKGLSTRSVIYHYLLPAEHVLVAPEGVFVFIIRPQEGDFVINDGRWHKKGGIFSRFATFFRQDMLGKPDQDAEREAARLQPLIDQVAPEVKVEPVIVFSSPNAHLEVVESDLPILSADPKQKPNLKTFLRDAKKRENKVSLSDEQINALEDVAGIVSTEEDA